MDPELHEDVTPELELPEEQLELADPPDVAPEHPTEEPKSPVAIGNLYDSLTGAANPVMPSLTFEHAFTNLRCILAGGNFEPKAFHVSLREIKLHISGRYCGAKFGGKNSCVRPRNSHHLQRALYSSLYHPQ